MLVALSLIVISFSAFIYHHPPSTWPWTLPSPPQDAATSASPGSPDTRGQTDEQEEEQKQTPPSSPSPQTTPRAAASHAPNGGAIPTFTLAEHERSSDDDDEEDDEDADNLPPPSFPALNSAQRASAQPALTSMGPPPKPTLMAPPPKPTPSSLMPPPPRPAPPSPSLRVPTTGPLPQRGPVPNRGPPGASGGLGVPATLAVKTPNARGKVLLSPGHSPLDWANLQRSGKNLSGVDGLIRVTPSMLKHNNGRKGKPAWSSYQGKVYNTTPYLPFHPGGEGELRRAAGKDGTKLFMDVHPWVNWDNMLGECLVGILVSQEQAPTETASSLEDMD